MRAKFTAIDDRHVVAEYDYDDPVTGIERVARTFIYVHGCVHEENSRGDLRQVCDGLDRYGSVLTMEEGEKLIDVIRREYRAMMRTERAERARDTVGRAWPGEAVTGRIHQG